MNVKGGVVIALTFMLVACIPSHAEFKEDLVQLSKTGKTKIFVGIGKSTRQEIQKRQNAIEHCTIKHFGSEFDIDKSAKRVLVVYCENFKPIALRLRKVSSSQYEIMGYWSIESQ